MNFQYPKYLAVNRFHNDTTNKIKEKGHFDTVP